MSDTILKLENVSKQYRLGLVGTGTLRHDLNRWWHLVRGRPDPYLKIGEENDRAVRGESEYVWALRDIDLDIKHGDVLGIIGRNGAGKSTLLKILSRVTSPTTGVIKSRGRIASLLEVGTGFHPELTGLENIYLNGTILGMTKAEITSKLEEIIAFSGCERYIETPVKRYSSGMKVRLAFAVAAHLEPEILVVDEVLAVGDVGFQKRALGKMKDISRGEGRTVLFVSHSMSAIKNLCKNCLLLEKGRVRDLGPTNEIVNHYLSLNSPELSACKAFNNNNSVVRMKTAAIRNGNIPSTNFHSGDTLTLRVELERDEPVETRLIVTIYDEFGEKVTQINNENEKYRIKDNATAVELSIERLPFVKGKYTMTLSLQQLIRPFYGRPLHVEEEALAFEVDPGDYYKIGRNVWSGMGDFIIKSHWNGA